MSSLATRMGIVTACRRREIETDPIRPATPFERALEALATSADALNLDSSAVHVAAELAAIEPALDDERRLSLVLLLLASMAAHQEGSTRLEVAGAVGEADLRERLTALAGDVLDAEAMGRAIENAGRFVQEGGADAIIGRSEGEYKPLLLLDGFLYQHRMHRAEVRLAERIAALLRPGEPLGGEGAADGALADLLSNPVVKAGAAVVLSPEQREAVQAVASARLTLISGGPGTGKTSIVLAMLRLLLRLGLGPEEIALAAPTGKAAYRLIESIRGGASGIGRPAAADASLARVPDARTLHRLLGYSPGADRFRHHRNNPLSEKVVIVDESSMVDLALMESLVGAVGRVGRLVLLGDADQLPSVEAGAVFRDLLRAFEAQGASGAPMQCVRLRQNYRMRPQDEAGRAILELAGKIRDGGTGVLGTQDDAGAARRAGADGVAFRKVELLEAGPGALGKFLDRWEAEGLAETADAEALAGRVYRLGPDGFEAGSRLDLERLFAHVSRSRILCITRVYETGAERVNERLHARAARRTGRAGDRAAFLPGEPVMVLRNDYSRSLFNGDQGVVVRVSEQGAPPAAMAVFRRDPDFAAFHLEMLRTHLALCHAMTVHKAQGSEFERVGVILPDKDIPLLTREVLYTAVTRARRSVVLVGPEALLARGISRAAQRSSGVAERILAALREQPSGG